MACTSVFLKDDLLTGADSGGTWVYDGYNSLDPNGTPAGGGSAIPTLVGDNPEINITGFVPGYYFFTYTGGANGCNEAIQTKMFIAEVPEAGTNNTLTYCTADIDVLNLQQELGGSPQNGGTWTQISGAPSPHPGFDATAGTFDLSQVTGEGTFQFEYEHQVSIPSGFTQDACDDCTNAAVVTVIIQESFDAGTADPKVFCI